uniref:Uncharacterized protein n=1 Tax=Arundo donax TaxID=35708 RepID=A0A0A9BCJ6_ARUDO
MQIERKSSDRKFSCTLVFNSFLHFSCNYYKSVCHLSLLARFLLSFWPFLALGEGKDEISWCLNSKF